MYLCLHFLSRERVSTPTRRLCSIEYPNLLISPPRCLQEIGQQACCHNSCYANSCSFREVVGASPHVKSDASRLDNCAGNAAKRGDILVLRWGKRAAANTVGFLLKKKTFGCEVENFVETSFFQAVCDASTTRALGWARPHEGYRSLTPLSISQY